MEVKSVVPYNRKDFGRGIVLNVTVKDKIRNAKPGLVFTLDLPCTSERLQNPGYELLLVTDVDVKPPRKRFYLGDSDVILPYTKKIEKIVKSMKYKYRFEIKKLNFLLLNCE